MTKQEKIHKMKLKVGSLITLGQMKETDKLWPTVEAIFDYLDSQGIVIKVDRELPILHPCQVCGHSEEGTDVVDGDWISCDEKDCEHIKKWKLKAGYVAVESLME